MRYNRRPVTTQADTTRRDTTARRARRRRLIAATAGYRDQVRAVEGLLELAGAKARPA